MTYYCHLYAQVELEAKFNGTAKAGDKGELEVKINKKNINSFAKYQIDLPTGISAGELDSRGGNFSIENNKAKIVWVNLPSENIFSIKIKIYFQSNTIFPVTLYQKFFYLENGVKKEIPGNPIIINEASNPTGTLVNADTKPETLNNNNQVSNKNQVVESKNISFNSIPNKENNSVNVSTSDNKVNDRSEKKAFENIDKKNVYTYRIQIAASAKPIDVNYSNIGETEIIQHNGMYKVMLKKEFTTKEDALKVREDLVNKGYSGAFIVKYQNGKRVN